MNTFTTSLFLSITVHMALFISYDLYLSKYPKRQITTSSEHRIKAKLVERGARVDIIKMPQQTIQELKELEKTEVSKVPSHRRNEIFLKLLQDISKREINNTVEKIEEVRKRPKVLIMAGSKISKGMALVGGKRDSELNGLHQYLASLPSHIKKHWKLPAYLAQKNLRCRIRIIISKEGELVKYSLIESSGVEEYDQAALKATSSSSLYPIPDMSIMPFLKQGYIILGFPD